MTRYERIKEALENMNTAEIVAAHNAYCEANNNMDDYIYNMEEFDEVMNGSTPWEATRAAFYGDFRPCDDYFRFNGYANLESFDYWKEETSGIYTSDIAQYIDDNDDNLDIDEISEILEETEDDEQ